MEILAARQSVEKLANDPQQPKAVRSQMSLARDMRQFAVDELGLPDNKSYKSYVDVGRDYVTIAVFAAPEFSIVPRVWCFPVFGCVPYRAHFSVQAAQREREGLERLGFDVHVTGVTAYSTLGWTGDPLLNTMFRDDETHLAAVMFHELAHQQVYVRDDSAFNEAFAVAVERTGVQKWLRENRDFEGLRRYEKRNRRSAEFLALIDETRHDLRKIYLSNDSDLHKRMKKSEAFERLHTRYLALRDTHWNSYTGYDRWFDGPLNNAKIAATAVYSELVPAFFRLFEACGENYARFYDAVATLGKIDRAKRLNALNKMSKCT